MLHQLHVAAWYPVQTPAETHPPEGWGKNSHHHLLWVGKSHQPVSSCPPGNSAVAAAAAAAVVVAAVAAAVAVAVVVVVAAAAAAAVAAVAVL